MTVYGALDTSLIDELPPGRRPVETTSRPNSMRSKVIKRIEEVCLEGQRVYWVCTLIEDSDELEAQAAEDLFQLLRIHHLWFHRTYSLFSQITEGLFKKK